MKKPSLVLMFCILLVFISGCSKNEIVSTDQSKIEDLNPGNLKEEMNFYDLKWVLWEYWDWECFCYQQIWVPMRCSWPPRNCLEEVVITGGSSNGDKAAADDFMDAYNDSTMAAFFSSGDYKTLFPSIDSLNGVVDSIIRGTFLLNFYDKPDDTLDYFIGLPALDYPLNLDDTTVRHRVKVVIPYSDTR